MMNRPNQANAPAPSPSMVQRSDNTFFVDAELIGELLNVSAADVPVLMHEGAITSVCERGIDDHDGEFRLTFFHRNRRARLSTDVTGRVLGRSAIDFGDRPIPSALRRPGG